MASQDLHQPNNAPEVSKDIKVEGSTCIVSDTSTKISLTRRAPTVPIPTRRWHMYLSYGFGSVDYDSTIEQKNQCIRSQLSDRSYRSKFHISSRVGKEFNMRSAGFPCPLLFRELIEAEQAGLPLEAVTREWRALRGGLNESESSSIQQRVLRLWLRIPSFKIERTSAVEAIKYCQPVYLVVGVFPRGRSSPRERVVFVENPTYLFWHIRWTSFRLRGLRSTLFSLRHVKGFKLYMCNSQSGVHERIELDENGNADLQLLLRAYNRWFTPSYATQAWAQWIHETLNNGSYNVVEGRYALELVLDWSVTRISIVILAPVLLSLAIGLWLNSSNWNDLGTIQTAWGTASYVVTAGSLLAALLAILSTIGINH
ncbi:hypothetical protein QBC38DRAFT_394365 [Podospora fimiseda]|uniref:Uncharacterized protein n=1 Tax=Podospora fimiseda TaxID=252190 RepID=A0AAN7GVX3_9PEZI|nr:hypothetical protein QBC38DRAFT_394365 [Podospora fimiseda]